MKRLSPKEISLGLNLFMKVAGDNVPANKIGDCDSELMNPRCVGCPRWDSNPHSEEPVFESGASANSATRAYHAFVRNTFRILTQAV